MTRRPPTNLSDHFGVPLDRPLRVALVGSAGEDRRCAAIATARRGQAEIVQIAERRHLHRNPVADSLGLQPGAIFTDWRDLVAADRSLDAAIIATQDRDHRPAIEAFAEAGYDILCEKPLAGTEDDCVTAVGAASTAGVLELRRSGRHPEPGFGETPDGRLQSRGYALR